MRTWQFGLFDAEHAAFDLDVVTGRSILAGYNNTSNSVSSTVVDPTDGTGTNLGFYPGTNPETSWWLLECANDLLKAQLGQIPVLVRVDLGIVPASTGTISIRAYRMLTSWDHGDANNRYSDISGLVTWHGDAYAPYPDVDYVAEPLNDTTAAAMVSNVRTYLEVTNAVERALRNNTPVRLLLNAMISPGAIQTFSFFFNPNAARRPTLSFFYFFPIEFYKDASGALDYGSIIDDDEDGTYYLGAVERGSTGTAKRLWIRNLSGEAQHLEILDDHPEWEDPVQVAGAGTGSLDYVDLLDAAVSQRYTVQFYSAAQFEVQAEAYRDNSTSLHPAINGDATWRGDTSTLFTAPSGGLKIPVAAWQPGYGNADEFEIVVRGNSTDTDWPSDSNDQVQMTEDDGDTPLTTGWRPIAGRRIATTATVAVDGATKLFPTRFVRATDWVAATPAFVHDADNIDQGTIDSVQEAAIGADTFTGSGLDDFTVSGNYNGNADRDYRVEVDGAAATDTFKWSNDGGSTWEATTVAMTGAAQLLEDGVYVTFAATTGHTATDRWDFSTTCYGVTLAGLTPGAHSYSSGAIVSTAVPVRDLAAAIYDTVDDASGASELIPSRLYVANPSRFTAGQTLVIQAVGDSGYEEAVIDTGGVSTSGGYLTLTAGLTGDYVSGDFVTVKGVGETSIWLRPVADSGTDEELKTVRLNARLL